MYCDLGILPDTFWTLCVQWYGWSVRANLNSVCLCRLECSVRAGLVSCVCVCVYSDRDVLPEPVWTVCKCVFTVIWMFRQSQIELCMCMCVCHDLDVVPEGNLSMHCTDSCRVFQHVGTIFLTLAHNWRVAQRQKVLQAVDKQTSCMFFTCQ